MTKTFLENMIHPVANLVVDISRAAEVKVPLWIKHRIVEKLYVAYKKRWKSWKSASPAGGAAGGGGGDSGGPTAGGVPGGVMSPNPVILVEEDSACAYFDCDENGNHAGAPEAAARFAKEQVLHQQNLLDCDCFHTTVSVSVSSSPATAASDNGEGGVGEGSGDGVSRRRSRRKRRRRDSTLSLREPVVTPIRNVVPGSIPVKDVQLTRLIGSGGFGTVYHGLLDGNTAVAVKKMHSCRKNIKAKAESFRAELRVLKLNHPNVVKTLAASELDLDDIEDPPSSADSVDSGKHGTNPLGEAYIIMEYTGDRNLQQVINDTTECMSIDRRVHFSLQLTDALDYVHGQHLVHLDIKPANILVCIDDTLKLADFGCCRVVQADTGAVSPTQRSYLTGTFAYRAPELLRGEQPSTKADIYSLGVTLWQMLSRDMPYNGQNQHVVIFGVVAYNLRPSLKHKRVGSSNAQTGKLDVNGNESVRTSNRKTNGITDVKTLDDIVCSSGDAGDEEEEHMIEAYYQDLFVQCWQSDPRDRPGAADLKEVFSMWQKYL